MNLLETTRQLLKARLATKTLREIAMESEGEVSWEWLRKFHDGTAENPTVTRVQSLHDYLKKVKTRSAA